MILKVKKLDPEAVLPTYTHSFDAGIDFHGIETVTLEPGEVGKVRSGLALEIPDGYVGLCWDRSGIATKNKIKVIGGVIDSGFRGELKLCVINLGSEPFTFEKGDSVCQILIQKVEHVEIAETLELSDSERGDKGFGSGK